MDATSNQSTAPYVSSTSSLLTPSSWDVFLSFYGKDTRSDFTSNLYKALHEAGIETFMDEPELDMGEEISQGLLNAIHGSNIAVVVLSENYASSKWCLNELIEILSCRRTNGQVTIPVFYHVDPSDIRRQKGSFGEALDFLRKHYSVDIIDKWKSALAEIGKLKGYHLENDAHEDEMKTIQEIVENVAPQACRKILHLEECLFGIDSAVEHIYKKLSMESNDVRAIGICGMGGIGKTTTAKAFYNKYYKRFNVSCFIEISKQCSQGGSPLYHLLNQLLIKLLRRKDYKVLDAEIGLRKLEKILSSKKALIVLDDLDQSSPSELIARLVNLLFAGSRIIITTRDVNLLNQLKVDISEVYIYMMKVLGQKESLELFSYHAFGKPMPPESFMELSVSFVTYGGCLPLALKVLGSSLRGRTHVPFWEAKLEKVREIPENGIQKILRMSYDELGDETEKAIFLDIVFFFVGKDNDDAVHIFKSCGFFPNVGIPILVERCLLTIDEDYKFQMHNLIQEMGREVIREESKHGKRKRLYLREKYACVAMQNLEATYSMECLVLDMTTWTKKHVSVKIFERMPNLRLLEIINAHDIKGNFRNSFHELRCIRWHHCPWTNLPSTFCPPNIVSLDMPYSELKTFWKGTMLSVRLRTINVSYSNRLKTTPDFSNLKLIEKLLFRGCKSLRKVHQSIGQLSNLSYLDLGECDLLKELPKSVGQLTKLVYLHLGGCLNLKRLPEPIEQLTNLGSLTLGHCSNLKRLPDQLGDMKGLKLLDASYTLIGELPDSIAHLKGLTELKLTCCEKLRKLPEQFGNMEGLRSFDAIGSAIELLPDSITRLGKLVNLAISGCHKLNKLPEQLGKMQCLKLLQASHTAIEELPESIGLLSSLQALYLSTCKIKYLPNSIQNLTSLKRLYLEHNARIDLPDTVKNMKLECLTLRCNIRLWLPTIQSISSLKSLSLQDEGDSLSSTKMFSLSKLSNLQHLQLTDCTSIGPCFPELPMNLIHLSLDRHLTLEQLPDFSSFKQLILLTIVSCVSLQKLRPLPPNLQVLDVRECTSLQEVPDLSVLKKLTTLSFVNCGLQTVSLNQSSLKVGPYSSFEADLPNREVAEWFSYKSSGNTVSLEISPILGDNLLGVALWFVYKCKHPDLWHDRYKSESIKRNYDIKVPHRDILSDEVQSRIICLKKEDISVKSGDRIKLTIQSLLYSKSVEVPGEKVNVETCGTHVIQKAQVG